MAQLRFFSHTMQGLSTLRQAGPVGSVRPVIALELDVETSREGDVIEQAQLALELYGPQDVVGLDARHIVRREPAPGSRDFEPNYLPFIEFDLASLPWAFSPDVQAPFRPWLCLLVVPEHGSVSLSPQASGPLAVLEVADVSALNGWAPPDLQDSAWWAHVQLAEDDAVTTVEDFEDVISAHPERVISRLICPLRLKPDTAYLACLVPSTLGGVMAGLKVSEPVTDPLAPAWQTDATTLRLPVYDQYSFRTGRAGDFEALVTRLRPTSLGGLSDGREIVIDPKRMGLGLYIDPIETSHRGVFAIPASPSPEPLYGELALKLRELFAQAHAHTSLEAEPVVTPPAYGSFVADMGVLGDEQAPLSWFDKLNTDLRLRAAAGAGARVIKRDQEQLMQSAWAQAGRIAEVNAYLSRLQLARSSSQRTHRRLGALPQWDDITLVQLVGPQLHRVRSSTSSSNTQTALALIEAEDPITSGLIDPAFRRLMRRDAHWMLHQTPFMGLSTTVAYRAMIGTLALVQDPDALEARSGMVSPRVYQNGNPIDPNGPTDRVAIQAQAQAIIDDVGGMSGEPARAVFAHLSTLYQAYGAAFEAPYEAPESNTVAQRLRPALMAQLEPGVVAERLKASRVQLPKEVVSERDRLEPVVLAPIFDHPMYEPLQRLDLGFVLPGIDGLGDNLIGLLQLHADVIEAYMVGLNHEMAREMLWRGFPADPRATYFRQFFDVSGHIPAPQTVPERELLYDLTSMHNWSLAEGLGEHIQSSSGGELLVLLLRGELLRRYPQTLVYAVPGQWHSYTDDNDNVQWVRRPDYDALETMGRFASFRAAIEPDITLLGFGLSAAQAMGSPDVNDGAPGYFFVLQEPMTQTRFGLNEAQGFADEEPELPPTSWAQLTWQALDLSQLPYISSTTLPAGFSNPPHPDEALWGEASQEMADILFQTPYLVAIHADDMLDVS